MKKYTKTLIALVLIIPLIHAIPVVVYISDNIDGNVINTTKTIDNRILTLNTIWENTGSASCKVYSVMEITPYNSTNSDKPRYIWSNPEISYPGSTVLLKNIWFIPSNQTYNITQYLYFCRQKKKINTYVWNFSKTNITKNYTSSLLNITMNAINKTTFKISITPNKPINKKITLYIIPSEYPSYWSIETKIINITDKTTTYITYEPEVWFSQDLNFIITDNSKYLKTLRVSNEPVKENNLFSLLKDLKEINSMYILYIVLLVIIVLVATKILKKLNKKYKIRIKL